jgi:peroxiredoxin
MKIYLFKFFYILGFILFLQFNLQAQSIKNLRLKTVNNKRIDINEYLNKGPIVISFWSSWCNSCQEKLKELKAVYDKYEKQGLIILAISVDSPRSLSKVRIAVKKFKLPYIFLIDPNGEQSKKLQVNEFPYTLLSNNIGNVVYSQRGYKKGDVLELDSKIKILLEI